jgi:GNAT superfamily N-acetyltransferase
MGQIWRHLRAGWQQSASDGIACPGCRESHGRQRPAFQSAALSGAEFLYRAQRGFPVIRLAPLTAQPRFPLSRAAQPALSDRLATLGLSLRNAGEADMPFLQTLFASFRAEEMAFVPWPQAQKDAFLGDQFRLQHRHFVRYFSGADFWIVERSLPPDPPLPVGRLYLDRSARLWRIVDIGFLPQVRGQGIGSALLQWAQACAMEAEAEGIDLHVLVTNSRAEQLYRSLGFRIEGNAEGYHRHMAWRPAAPPQLNTA